MKQVASDAFGDTAALGHAKHTVPGPRFLGLLGWPVEHSLSPAMHNAALRELGLDWVYGLLPVPPAALGDAVRGLRALQFQGANVTVPHKQAVIPYLDGLTPAAQTIGAVNTIFWGNVNSTIDIQAPHVLESPRLLGDNTDASGFLADLRAHDVEVSGITALILGAGGAARAVSYALLEAGCSLILLNRTVSRAAALANGMQQAYPRQSIRLGPFPEHLAGCAAEASLIVNTTSIGMWPDVDRLAWDARVPFRPDQVVYDLVYRPRRTALLRRAEAAGAQVIGGAGMLAEQGAAALVRWTGLAAPIELMRETVERQLAEPDSTPTGD